MACFFILFKQNLLLFFKMSTATSIAFYVILVIVTVKVIIYFIELYSKKKYSYLQYYGYDGPKPSIKKLGNLLEFRNLSNSISKQLFIRHYSKTLYKWSRKYGSIYCYYEAFTPILVISNVDLVREIFTTKKHEHLQRKSYPLAKRSHENDAYLFLNNGARWERVRKCMEKIMINQNNIMSCLENQDRSFKKLFNKLPIGRNIDIYQRVRCLCANTMFESVFGMKLSEYRQNNDDDIKLIEELSSNFDIAFKKFQNPTVLRALALIFRGFDWFFYRIFKIKTKIFAFFKLDDFIDPLYWFNKNYIKKYYRKKVVDKKFCFFKLFLNFTKCSNSDTFLTVDEALSNILLIFLAGFETTSASIAFACHVLGTDKSECEKLYVEIMDLVERKNLDVNKLTIDDMAQLTYLERFIREVLRMYPIANSMLAREWIGDGFKIGKNDEYYIPKDVNIVVDVLSIHYNQKLWGEHDVKKFFPDRFLDSTIHPAAWLPFGKFINFQSLSS